MIIGIFFLFIFSEFIFSDKDNEVLPTGQNDGQYELLAHVERSVRANLKNFILKTEPTVGDSLLAGSCAMALCYIHRYEFCINDLNKINLWYQINLVS